MVDPAISKALLDVEFEEAQPFAQAMGWELLRTGDLQVKVSMTAPIFNDIAEIYVFEFTYDDYEAKPPIIDVIHPNSFTRNQPDCFPTGHGYFHQKARICAGWNRRAYKEEFADGPHDDFHCATWQSHAEDVVSLGLILQELGKALKDPNYRGRDSA